MGILYDRYKWWCLKQRKEELEKALERSPDHPLTPKRKIELETVLEDLKQFE